MVSLICVIFAVIVLVILAKHTPKSKNDSEVNQDDDSDYSTWVHYDDD